MVRGPINGQGTLSTDPLYLDVELPAGAAFTQTTAADYSAFVYPYEGSPFICAAQDDHELEAHQAGVLGPGDRIEARAGAAGGRGSHRV